MTVKQLEKKVERLTVQRDKLMEQLAGVRWALAEIKDELKVAKAAEKAKK